MAGREQTMTRSRVAEWVTSIVRIVIGGVFIYAGALKLVNPARFAVDIDHYHLLPWIMSVSAAFYIPWLEILCGLALIIRWLRRGAIVILSSLVVVFIVASLSARMRGIDVSCGCFGHIARNLPFAWHLFLDIALFSGLIFLWWRARGSFRPNDGSIRGST
jgi:putative oxidoreductase